MKFCKCKFSYVFDHECDQSTAPCPNSAILKESSTDHITDVGKMVGKTDPSTEQESQEELWLEVMGILFAQYLSKGSMDYRETMKQFTITRKS